MQQIIDFINGPIGQAIINVFVSLLILIIGYLLARIIASIIRRLLKRTDLDNRLAGALTDDPAGPRLNVEDTISKIVFWLLFLFVIVAFLDQLGLVGIAAPINNFLQDLTTVYIPSIGGAALLLFLAWVLAAVLRLLVQQGANLLKVDERLARHAALEDRERVSVGQSLATAVFWFTLLLFLPAILSTLGIEEVAAPLQSVFNSIFGYVPSILAAGLTFLVGWFIARIVRQIAENLLRAIGADGFGARLGMPAGQSLSRLVGTILYVTILLFVLVAALEQLDIAAISEPTTLMLTTIIDAVPGIIAAALVLIVSFYLGRFVGNLVQELLASVGFDTIPGRLGFDWRGRMTLSQVAGYLVLVAIMLFAVSSAAELLGSAFLVTAIATFIAFFWQVVLAVVILAIGLYFARLAYELVLSTAGVNALFTARLARITVIIFAAALALRQLGIANDIVNLAFGLSLGAVALAVALAFGLGSREIAGREVDAFLVNYRADTAAAEARLSAQSARREAVEPPAVMAEAAPTTATPDTVATTIVSEAPATPEIVPAAEESMAVGEEPAPEDTSAPGIAQTIISTRPPELDEMLKRTATEPPEDME